MPIREHVELTAEEQVSDEFRKAGGSVEGFGATLKKFAVGAGIGIAINKAADLTGQVAKMAIDAGEAEAAFDTTFGEALPRASAFVDEFASKAGFATYELKQMLAITGNVVQGIGATEQESAALSERMAILAGDVASFSNAQGGAEAVMLALQSAINGEREALKTYGLAINEAEVQQRALLDTGKERADELTRLEKAEATVAVAYEKAGKAIGDLDRTQDSAANTLRRLGARLKDAGVEAGERLLPAIENLLPKIEESIPAITDAAIAIAQLIANAANSAPVEHLGDLIDGLSVFANSFIAVGADIASAFTLGEDSLDDTADLARHANDLRLVARSLRDEQVPGANAATQYANALAQVQRQSFITEDAIDRLATAAGASSEEQLAAIRRLQDYGREHGYTREEMGLLGTRARELQIELGILTEEGYTRGEAAARDFFAASAEGGEALPEVGEGSREAADGILEMVGAAKEAAAAFRDDLAEEANSFITGFEELPDRVDTTMDEFETNLTERVAAQTEFWEGLATLAESGFGHLAEEIREQGPSAAGLLEELVGDMERAAELDEMIQSAGEQMGDVTGEYATALEQHGDEVLTPLGEFGLSMTEAIAEGIESGDLVGPLLTEVQNAVAAVTGKDFSTGTGGGGGGGQRTTPGGTPILQSGSWGVPGSPSDEINAILHGTEIVIPPEGTGGRAEFARQLAAELAGVMTTGDRGGGVTVTIEHLEVVAPSGSTITEQVSAAAAESAIEALLS